MVECNSFLSERLLVEESFGGLRYGYGSQFFRLELRRELVMKIAVF
jgi:hypothetical protein